MAIGEPYWKTNEVRVALIIYGVMAALVFALFLSLWRSLNQFGKLARGIENADAGDSFAARNRIPELQSPRALDRGCAESDSPAAPGARLLLLPEGPHTLAGAVVGLSGPATGLHLSLLSGPEGGFSAEEIALAQQHGFVACRLGPRVLRAETAPLAALATIQALIGDFGASDAATT